MTDDKAISKEYALDEIEDELDELEAIVVGEQPTSDYTRGFRDGLQHARVAVRYVLDDT